MASRCIANVLDKCLRGPALIDGSRYWTTWCLGVRTGYSCAIETSLQANTLVSKIVQWIRCTRHHEHGTPAVPDEYRRILGAMPMYMYVHMSANWLAQRGPVEHVHHIFLRRSAKLTASPASILKL
jgi:hypothetical protein